MSTRIEFYDADGQKFVDVGLTATPTIGELAEKLSDALASNQFVQLFDKNGGFLVNPHHIKVARVVQNHGKD